MWLSNKEISCIAVGRHPKQLLKRIRLLKDTINVRIDKACLRILIPEGFLLKTIQTNSLTSFLA